MSQYSWPDSPPQAITDAVQSRQYHTPSIIDLHGAVKAWLAMAAAFSIEPPFFRYAVLPVARPGEYVFTGRLSDPNSISKIEQIFVLQYQRKNIWVGVGDDE
jgi:hypothetical protein